MSHFRRFIAVQKTTCLRTWRNSLKCQSKTFSSGFVNNENYQTMATVKENLVKILKGDPSLIQKSQEVLKNILKLPKSQNELPVRKIKDSFDSAIIPLSHDLDLRDKYTTVHGSVRIGRLMEDLDLMAVWSSVKHVYGKNKPGQEPFPYVIVTINVEDIQIFWDRSQTTSDIRLSSHVCWVGKTSLEVIVWMDQFVQGKWNRILKALLLMAARNAKTYGPMIVNPLEAETEEERNMINSGEERRKKRSQMLKESVLTTVPTTEELNLIHGLFIKSLDPNDVFLHSRVLPPNSQWMHDATLGTLIFCHPEHRNVYNKIFGGFLIRKALELSWCMAVAYGLRNPKIVHISDITFHYPVDVGSLVKMYAAVTYTEQQYVQIFVHAIALDFHNLKGKNTTSFNFTYDVMKPVDQIYPSTYLEAMRYIDGRRRFIQVMKHSELI